MGWASGCRLAWSWQVLDYERKEKGAENPPLIPAAWAAIFGCYLYSVEPKERYFSLPTKPNFVTPDALMMFSTRADRS